MRLLELKLTNYRNCKDLTLNLNSEKILIIGKNAQGKTNILESIYFLSTLKSPRTSNNIEIINFDAEATQIETELIKANTSVKLDYSYSKEKTRILKVNGVKTTPKLSLIHILFGMKRAEIKNELIYTSFVKYFNFVKVFQYFIFKHVHSAKTVACKMINLL